MISLINDITNRYNSRRKMYFRLLDLFDIIYVIWKKNKSMKQYEYIFFDFDGTIVNTINGTRESALYALKHFGIDEEFNKELGKIFCGPPLKESFKKYNLNDNEVDEAIKLYRKFQSENTIECNELYDNIDEMLIELKEKNKKLVIVTAKLENTAKKILEYFKILEKFDFVVGATENGERTNKNDILKYAISLFKKINIDKCIMIGDRVSDIKAGQINNMDTIGVSYGMDEERTLKNANATYIAKSAKDILNILK